MLHILAGVLRVQGADVAADDDSLFQLPQIRGAELPRQFRRSGQYDLNQLGSAGLQIGEETKLLHQFLAQVLRLIKDMQRQPQLKRAPATDLARLLEAALGTVRRRSLVFVVSDFISLPGWDRPLGMLAQRHEVLAIRLYDPREVELPDVGPLLLEDAETGEQIFVDTHDRRFRERFAVAAHRREHGLKVAFSRAGVDLLSLSTEGDMAREIVRFAVLRRQQKKVPAAFAGPPSRGTATRRNVISGRSG